MVFKLSLRDFRVKVLIVFFTSCLIFILGERLGYSEGARGVSKNIIKIGAIIDQTGAAASVGIPIAEATKMYFRHINEQGGINGRNVKILIEDDHYTIPGAVSSFKKLVFKDRVLSILFSAGTGQTTVLLNQYKKEKVPVITVSLAETMTNPVKRYIFTPTASYDDGIKVIIDYIMKNKKRKKPKIVIVYPDVEFGKSGVVATEKYLTNYNTKLLNKTVLALSAFEASSQVLSLKRLNPDYIILHNAASAIIAFLKTAHKYGLKKQIFGTFYVSSEDTISISGKASEGLLAVSPFTYWYDDNPGMNQLKKIVGKYQPNAKPKIRNFTQGWLTSMICAEGLKRAGKRLAPDSLVSAYETFKNWSTGGIASPISYSKTNHKGGSGNILCKTDIKAKRFIPITKFREPKLMGTVSAIQK